MAVPVIHICGWPGSGKATIGRILAQRLGGRLIDNHLSLDPASALFARGDPGHAPLRATIRAAIDAAAIALPPDVPLVVTDALSDDPVDDILFAPTRDLARAREAPLLCVTLDLSADENRRRLADPSRATRAKLTDPHVLDTLRGRHRLLRPPHAVPIDITHLAPDAAAAAILHALDLTQDAGP
ncbi:MAG: nucleoside kinase [Rhodobacteraceae bacterium]|nr:nucleoside kinase [Paracoccaceae bacterium]